jgi:hypothetical protein
MKMTSKTVTMSHRKMVKTACPAPLISWALGSVPDEGPDGEGFADRDGGGPAGGSAACQVADGG